MAGNMLINKSGSSFSVYNSQGSQIGTIYNREVYVNIGGEGSCVLIEFLGPNGQLQTGQFNSDSLSSSAFTPITNYPYRTENINGTNYKVFKFRRTENIYLPNADYWGQVASGMYVACHDTTCGQSHPDWKLINYVMKTPENEWISVEGYDANGVHYDYGFVDTGLSDGSMYNTISMYGDY